MKKTSFDGKTTSSRHCHAGMDRKEYSKGMHSSSFDIIVMQGHMIVDHEVFSIFMM